MRWYNLIPLALLLATSVAGHPGEAEDHVQHMQINKGSLEPGANTTYHINFQGQPFEAGWIMIVQGKVSAPVDVVLSHGGQAVKGWTWTSDAINSHTTALPATAEYEVQLSNPGDENATFAFTYDQTCECSAKVVSMDDGTVFFNWQLAAGETASIDYNLTFIDQVDPTKPKLVPSIDGFRIQAQAARQIADGGVWPQDFEMLGLQQANDSFSMALTAEEADRYIVQMTVTYDAADGHSVLIWPFLDLTPVAADKGSPGPAIGALLVGALTLAAIRRR